MSSSRPAAVGEVEPEGPTRPGATPAARVAAPHGPRYIVIEQLGRGGMGVVRRAYDPTLQREVALKSLRGRWAEEDRGRLVLEARAMAKLNHPNVVAVYDVQIDGPSVTVVMELVEGADLRQWLRQPRPWTQIVEVFRLAARGLQAAHDVGLLHRDFKPDNVLVAEDLHAAGAVKVADFGLVSMPELDPRRPDPRAPTTGSGTHTETGMVLGTLPYMAPEQHGAAALSPATDQYAFCVALWEALVGERPFGTRGSTAEELAEAKADGPPPWPARAKVPRWIGTALRRGLSPDPADRWPSVAALTAGLDVRRRRSSLRRRWGAAGVLSVGTVAVAGIATSPSEAPCVDPQGRLGPAWDAARREAATQAVLGTGRDFAAASWERTLPSIDGYANAWGRIYQDACEATAVHHTQTEAALDLRMACLADARSALDAMTTQLTLVEERDVARLHELVATLPELERCSDVEALTSAEPPPPRADAAAAVASVRAGLSTASSQLALAHYDAAQETIDALEDEVRAVAYPPLTAEWTFWAGEAANANGEYDRARTLLQDAFGLALRHHGRALTQQVSARLSALTSETLDLRDPASAYSRLALALAPVGSAARAIARSLNGDRLAAEGEIDAAEAELRLALAEHEAVPGVTPVDLIPTQEKLASLLDLRQQAEEALPLREGILAVAEEAYGPDHPKVAHHLNNSATTRLQLRQYDAAEAELRRALAIKLAAWPPDHPAVANGQISLALVLRNGGHVDDAEALIREALPTLEAKMGRDHLRTAMARAQLADLMVGRGEFEAAERENEEVRRVFTLHYGPNNLADAVQRSNLAGALRARGRYAEAESEYRAAIEVWTKVRGPRHANTMTMRTMLAQVVFEQGRAREAIAIQTEAVAGLRAVSASHPNLPDVLEKLAVMQEATGARQAAERSRNEAAQAQALIDAL